MAPPGVASPYAESHQQAQSVRSPRGKINRLISQKKTRERCVSPQPDQGYVLDGAPILYYNMSVRRPVNRYQFRMKSEIPSKREINAMRKEIEKIKAKPIVYKKNDKNGVFDSKITGEICRTPNASAMKKKKIIVDFTDRIDLSTESNPTAIHSTTAFVLDYLSTMPEFPSRID